MVPISLSGDSFQPVTVLLASFVSKRRSRGWLACMCVCVCVLIEPDSRSWASDIADARLGQLELRQGLYVESPDRSQG